MKWLLNCILWVAAWNITRGENKIRIVQFPDENRPGLLFERAAPVVLTSDTWKIYLNFNIDGVFKYVLKMSDFVTEMQDAIVSSAVHLRPIAQLVTGGFPQGREKENEYRDQINEMKDKIHKSFTHLKLAQNRCVNTKMPAITLHSFAKNFNSMIEMRTRLLMEMDYKRITIESPLSIMDEYAEFDYEIEKRMKKGRQADSLRGYPYVEALELMRDIISNITKDSEAIYEGIKAAKAGSLTKELITNDRWQEAMSLIKYQNLPLTVNNWSFEKFSKYFNATCGAFDTKVLIVIEIPLLVDKNYTLYELQAFPVPQRINRHLGAAFIRPSEQYIIAGDDDYYMVKQSYLRLCKKFDVQIYCPSNWLTHTREKNCEYSLLKINARTNLTKCNIKYTNDFEPTLVTLNSINGWMFSTIASEKLTLRCENEPARTIHIQGMGTVNFTSKCRIDFKGKINYNIAYPLLQKYSQEEIIIPRMQLNIKNLTRIFGNKKANEYFRELTTTEEEKSFWEVEKMCRKIMKNNIDDEITNSIFYILGVIIIITLLLVMGILLFMCYFKTILDDTPDEIELELQKLDPREPEACRNDGPTHMGVLRFK